MGAEMPRLSRFHRAKVAAIKGKPALPDMAHKEGCYYKDSYELMVEKGLSFPLPKGNKPLGQCCHESHPTHCEIACCRKQAGKGGDPNQRPPPEPFGQSYEHTLGEFHARKSRG